MTRGNKNKNRRKCDMIYILYDYKAKALQDNVNMTFRGI